MSEQEVIAEAQQMSAHIVQLENVLYSALGEGGGAPDWQMRARTLLKERWAGAESDCRCEERT